MLSSDGDGRHDVSGVGSGGDVVLLLLSLVVSDDEAGGTRTGKIRDDGRANCHHEVSDECLHVCAHWLLVPPANFAVHSRVMVGEGLVSGLGVEVGNCRCLLLMRLEAIRFVDRNLLLHEGSISSFG